MAMMKRSLAAWAALVGTALLLFVGRGEAELWKCTQSDGTVTFNDGGGAGCREMGNLPELQSTRSAAASSPGTSSSKIEAAAPLVPKKVVQTLSSRPFAPTSRTVPNLYYKRFNVKGWSRPNKGDVAMVQIDVSFLPTGNGPYLSTDQHFKAWPMQAFAVAVLAAAKAVQYDPRYLRVHLTIPIGTILHADLQVDGPSAGGVQAVAVAAALLGDSIRPDVCMSGTIDMNLVVGPVGGLEDKVDGCHLLPQFHEMLLPAGQNTFAITDKGMARSIKITEVGTLAEAYQVMTGQPIRPL
jgi:hypothetical protein